MPYQNYNLLPTFLNFLTVSQISRTSWSDLSTTLSWPNSSCSTGSFVSVSGGFGAIFALKDLNRERLPTQQKEKTPDDLNYMRAYPTAMKWEASAYSLEKHYGQILAIRCITDRLTQNI